jgi:hypothetical protein
MSLPASFGSIPVVANGVVGDIPSVPRLAIPTPDSGWETERGGDSGRGRTASDGGRPMTTREGSRRSSRSRAMSGFKDIWDENRVDEVRGPSEVVSRAVSASIDTDIGGHAADSENVVELLRGRPDVGPSGGQRLSALSLQRKAEKNRSQSAFAMGGGRRRSEALSAKGAGGGGGGTGGREAGPADFASAGLLAHFELQKMKAMGGVQGGAGGGGEGGSGGGGGKAMIDEARLGKCCAIMETMTVKYFDEEIAQLKDELFRCIFRDFDKLERSGEPRTAQAFVDANPFFKLLDREKAKTRKLQEENKGSWIKLQELRETNARLEKRLEMLSLPSLEAPHLPGGDGDGRGGKGAAGRRPATGVDGVGGRGGGGRMLGRASTAVPGGGNNRHGRIQQQASTPFLGEGAGSDSLFDLLNANATVSVKHGGGAVAPGAVGKGGQQQQQHASATASTKASIMSSVEELKAAVIEGQKKNQGRDKDLTAMVYFGAAFKEVNKMVSSLNDFEEFEAAVNAKESGVESTVTTKTGQGFVKRRRGDMEARWRDFSKWLSRHPEAREKAETCGQLRPIYEDWKAVFEYKAEFSTMIRALERHKQVVVGKQICKDGSYKLSFSERVGENPMDPSSDEDEDMEELVAKRDETILMLQSKVQAIDQTVAACNEMNAQQMELRVGELEKLHLELETAEKKRQEEELAARDATIENLRGTLSECRQEIAQKDRMIAGLSSERMQEMEEKLKEMEKREKNMQNQVGEAMERVSEAKNKHAALAGEIEAMKAKQESNREEWNRKGKYMVERSERDKEEEKKQALLRLEEQHARQMSMYKEVLRKPAVISSERLNIILETFGMLQRAVGSIMQGVESLPEQDKVALASRTAREFDACHAALLESVATEEEQEEEARAAAAGGGAVGGVGISGGYGGDEIVEFVRLSDHGMQTEPMAADYMPEDGGGGKQGKGGKDKKGKKGDKKGDKKAAKVGWGTDEKLRNEMSVNLHRTIEVVYRHKEDRDALQDGVELPRDSPVTCLKQMLVEKHLRWEAATEEEMRISSLALAFKGLDKRATLFGRLFGIFDPLPPAFCDCFMSLRRHASFKPAGARQVRWTRSVIDNGLPPDSEGELPRCEEGTVLSEVGRCALDLLCKQFRIETVLAERILSGYEMEDTLSEDVVLGVADIVLSAAKQMDVRSQIIIDAFQKTCQGETHAHRPLSDPSTSLALLQAPICAPFALADSPPFPRQARPCNDWRRVTRGGEQDHAEGVLRHCKGGRREPGPVRCVPFKNLRRRDAGGILDFGRGALTSQGA